MVWPSSGPAAVASVAEPAPPHRRRARLFSRLALVAVGAAGFAAALTLAFEGMRDVLAKTGGFCASGGPYVVANSCPAGSTRQVAIGLVGLFVAGGVFLAATAWMEGPTLGASLLMWSAVFGVLGYNFLTVSGGSAVTGVVFELMALGALIPLGALVVGWARRGGRPEPPVFDEDNIVRAVVPGIAP